MGKKSKNPIVQLIRVTLVPLSVLAVLGLVAISFGVLPVEPSVRAYAEKFVFLQYQQPAKPGEAPLYGTGKDDRYFVVFAVLVLTAVRQLLKIMLFVPFGKLMGVPDLRGAKVSQGDAKSKSDVLKILRQAGAKIEPESKRKEKWDTGDSEENNKAVKKYFYKREQELDKFVESAWQWIYYLAAWTTGFTIMYTEHGFSTAAMWTSYPTLLHSALMKSYYLGQLGFWLHMILITLVEPWRNDFPQMMAHHFITSGLIIGSYGMNHVRVGTAVLVEQDFADIFLPLAKMFKYAQWSNTCDIVFALFALTWIPTRHGIFFVIYYSIWKESPELVPKSGTGWIPEKGIFYNEDVVTGYMIALGLFQLLLCMWLRDLLKAVYKALSSSDNVEDHRSDSEEEDDEKTPLLKKDE